MKPIRMQVLGLLILMSLLTACGGGGSGGNNPATGNTTCVLDEGRLGSCTLG